MTKTNTHRLKKKKKKKKNKPRTCKYVYLASLCTLNRFHILVYWEIPNCREHAVCVHSWVLRSVCMSVCLYMRVFWCVWMRLQHVHYSIWWLVRFSCYKLNMSNFYAFSFNYFIIVGVLVVYCVLPLPLMLLF